MDPCLPLSNLSIRLVASLSERKNPLDSISCFSSPFVTSPSLFRSHISKALTKLKSGLAYRLYRRSSAKSSTRKWVRQSSLKSSKVKGTKTRSGLAPWQLASLWNDSLLAMTSAQLASSGINSSENSENLRRPSLSLSYLQKSSSISSCDGTIPNQFTKALQNSDIVRLPLPSWSKILKASKRLKSACVIKLIFAYSVSLSWSISCIKASSKSSLI